MIVDAATTVCTSFASDTMIQALFKAGDSANDIVPWAMRSTAYAKRDSAPAPSGSGKDGPDDNNGGGGQPKD